MVCTKKGSTLLQVNHLPARPARPSHPLTDWYYQCEWAPIPPSQAEQLPQPEQTLTEIADSLPTYRNPYHINAQVSGSTMLSICIKPKRQGDPPPPPVTPDRLRELFTVLNTHRAAHFPSIYTDLPPPELLLTTPYTNTEPRADPLRKHTQRLTTSRP